MIKNAETAKSERIFQMENNRNEIDIKSIMSQIKQDIKDKGLSADMLSFEDIPFKKASDVYGTSLDSAEEAMCCLNSHYYVQPYKNLSGNPVKVFVRKVIRKLVKFYVEPVVFEQNNLNANTVKVLNYLVESASENENNKTDVQKLSQQIEAMEIAQKQLVQRIDSLEQENSKLRLELGKGIEK